MQIESSIVHHINAGHAEFVALGNRNASGVIEQINKAREIGLNLLSAKDALKGARDENGDKIPWKVHFSEKGETNFTFSFTYRTARNYIRVAEMLDNPITSLPEGVRVLTDMFRMVEALPSPEGGEQKAHDPGFMGRSVKHVTSLLGLIGKWRESEPVEKWSPKQREDMKLQLQPVVEFYGSL